MSTAKTRELADILDRIKTWSVPSRLALARRILESVEGEPTVAAPPRVLPVDAVVGLLKTADPPPTDEEVRRIIEEERLRKYGE